MTTAAQPSRRTVRSFGFTVGAVLVLIGAYAVLRGKLNLGIPIAVAGALLVGFAALAPKLLVLPYRGWMALAEGMSWVMTRVILFLVFVLVVTPIGVIRRLTGADPLRRRTGSRESYWSPYPERHRDPRHYEKMF
jgi:hypothetical protein